MNELTLHDEQLGEIRIRVHPLPLPEAEIRVFVPMSCGGHNILHLAMELARSLPADAAGLDAPRTAALLYELSKKLDPTQRRPFHPWSYDPTNRNYSETFVGLLQPDGDHWLPFGEQFRRILDRIARDEPDGPDFDDVRFEVPDIATLLTRDEFRRYRGQFTADLGRLLADSGEGAADRFVQAVDEEEARASRFADLVARANQLRLPILVEAHCSQIPVPDWSGSHPLIHPRFLTCLLRHLDLEAGIAVLRECYARMEELYGSPGERPVISLLTPDPRAQTAYSVWVNLSWIAVNLQDRSEPARMVMRSVEYMQVAALGMVYKHIYRCLRDEASLRLTRAEQRLFCAMYSPNASLGFRIPVWEPLVVTFFRSVPDRPFTRFLTASILKSGPDRIGIGRSLWKDFGAFLKFYPAWLATCRDEDRERKRSVSAIGSTAESDRPEAGGVEATPLNVGCTPRCRRSDVQEAPSSADVSEDVLSAGPLSIPLPDEPLPREEVDESDGHRVQSVPAGLLESGSDPLENLLAQERAAMARRVGAYCTPREFGVLRSRACDGRTLEDIAGDLGVSYQRVQAILKSAQEKAGRGLRAEGLGP